MLTDGVVFPVIFLLMKSGRQVVTPLQLPHTPAEKRAYMLSLGLSIHLAGEEIQEAVMLVEGWFVEVRNVPNPMQVVPSEHPQRKEVITVVGRNADRTRFTSVVRPITRDAQGNLSLEPAALAWFNEPYGDEKNGDLLLDFLFAAQER